MGTKVCNCYVSKLSFQQQMTLRYGAHNHNCQKYRPSADPVDRANDEDFRSKHDGK